MGRASDSEIGALRAAIEKEERKKVAYWYGSNRDSESPQEVATEVEIHKLEPRKITHPLSPTLLLSLSLSPSLPPSYSPPLPAPPPPSVAY